MQFSQLYLIEILHQTTTDAVFTKTDRLLYLIEILHQTTTPISYDINCNMLYLIEILHQTTTDGRPESRILQLYLIEILHQTTTSGLESADILHYISKLSSLKSPNSHFDEVNLMYFSMSKNKANIRKISKKTPVAEVYPVWPVRPSPRNS